MPDLQRTRYPIDERLVWKYARSRNRTRISLEWDDLIDAIRQDKPYNEVQRGAVASLVTSMGRMAAHTGQVVTYDEMARVRSRVRPGRRQARGRLAGAAATGRGRQVPGAAAGPEKDTGILNTEKLRML